MDRYIDRYKYIQIRSTLSVYQLAQEQDTIISIKNACGFSLFTFYYYILFKGIGQFHGTY